MLPTSSTLTYFIHFFFFSSFSIFYKSIEKETQHIFITTSNLIMSIIDLSVCEHRNICNYRTIIRVTLFNPSSHLYMRMRAYVYISSTINWSSSIHSVTRQVGLMRIKILVIQTYSYIFFFLLLSIRYK